MHIECPVSSFFFILLFSGQSPQVLIYDFNILGLQLGCVKLNLCLTLNSSITNPYVLVNIAAARF